MKWQFLPLVLSLFSITILVAQDETVLETDHSCGIDIKKITITHDMLEFSSNSEANQVMNDIMKNIGLRPNYTIQAADVPNAAAVVIGQKRYILYNPKFIKSVNKSTNSDWSSISILAHELGHHLNGHTLSNKGSRPRMELEADEFSGFVLRKMGASLEEAQTAMNLLASPYGSVSHPSRGARLDAIKRGWDDANAIISDYSGGQMNTTQTTQESSPANEQSTANAENPSNNNQSSTTNERPSTNSPKPAVDHPSYAKYYIKLNANPNKYYYLTHSNDFITVSRGQPYPLGRLEKNFQDENFPNVIRIKGKGQDLYISRKGGKLFTKAGKEMGYIKSIR